MAFSSEIEQHLSNSEQSVSNSHFAQAERELKKAINLYSAEAEGDIFSSDFARLLLRLAAVYSAWPRTAKAETAYFKVIETLEQAPDPDYALLCESLNGLAELYISVNKMPQAVPLLDKAHVISQEWLERNDETSMQIMRNLAHVLFKLNKLTQAKPIGEKLLLAQETTYGARHPDLVETHELLADLKRSQRQFSSAESHYKRALSIDESVSGAQSESVARLMRKYAGLHCDKQDHTLAKPLLKKALAIRKALKKPQDEEYANAYLQLADVYYVECNYEPSELYFKKAISIRKKLMGAHTLEYADALCGVGKLYCAMKRFREAENNFNNALQIQIDLLGPYNKEVAATLNKLAGVYMSQGRFNEANLMKDQALACQVQHMQLTVDDFDPFDRAVLYHSQGAYKEAEEFYYKALAKVERNLGTDHFHLGEILTKMAELHRSLDRLDKAEMLLLQALKIFERMQHRAVLSTYAVLADLYVSQQRYDEAEKLYLTALSLLDDAIGVRQSDQLSIMGGYEKLLNLSGRKTEADKFKAKLRSIVKKSKNFQSIIQKTVRPEV